MHTQPMSDLDGTFSDLTPCHDPCPKCYKKELTFQTWDSDCGGYTDYKYTCQACKYSWWVDGSDA